MSASRTDPERSVVGRLTSACLRDPLPVFLVLGLVVLGGLLSAPFPWDLGGVPRRPVPVDAIPDTGENQQIVFTEWPGRSPQDVEDQVTYPLTVALLGVAGVESVRSTSMFGISSINVIFEERVEFYWARARLLEKLSSLSAGALPDGVEPGLGPDATALGQVFWYTLEGWADADGTAPARPVGGFGLDELRTVQDWQVRYALAAVPGVAEVASVGGFVREYQIDVDPDAMRAHGVTLEHVFDTVRTSNLDVGARTLELNRAEYVVRGLGFVESVEDLEQSVVRVVDGIPVTLNEIATVGVGPALRRGALDKAGVEAVGGVVVARYGANPLEVIEGVHAAIAELEPSLPRRVLDDGTEARVRIVPFYDRSVLIRETLGTLEDALSAQVLVTVAVVLIMLARLRPALLVAGLLPFAVLATFGGMKVFGVDANVIALSGIAIAIGSIVDIGIVLVESIGQHSTPQDGPAERLAAIRRGTAEVASAVLTAVLTTVVGFLPVFAMTGAEGKLFGPLAWTKTLALLASILLALTVVPAAARVLLGVPENDGSVRRRRALGAVLACVATGIWLGVEAGLGLLAFFIGLALVRVLEERTPRLSWVVSAIVALTVFALLGFTWEPAGPARDFSNLALTLFLLGVPLVGFWSLERIYEPCLRWCLDHKALFSILPVSLVLFGSTAWLGFDRVFGWLPNAASRTGAAQLAREHLPGLGREFMPSLDEGSFLLMPVTMPHASIGEALELLQLQDRRISNLPEVKSVVGKIGRAESPLDPAPVAMVETVIDYWPEYRSDASGRVLTFQFDRKLLKFVRNDQGELIPDPDGRPFRQWRPEIRSPRDIWDAIAAAADVPGMTTASMLQPIETRRIMLETGLRAPIGVKVYAPDLDSLDSATMAIEQALRDAPGVEAATVNADRVVGKPYLEIDLDRERMARYGLSVRGVQDTIEMAIGGRPLTTTVEGRERYPVRVRYPRELRGTPDSLERVLVGTPGGAQVPLGQLADVRYTPGPQSLRSEDTQLVAYVTLAGLPGTREVDVVEGAEAYLKGLVDSGELSLPQGVRYRFAGQFENQVRAAATLRIVLPVALVLILMLLHFQFRRLWVTAIVFSGIAIAWAGGFGLLWLWGREGFLDFDLAGVTLSELFQTGPVALSVAVWVGFLALFGIATDDSVLMATYLEQRFAADAPKDRRGMREATVQAALRRVRPCLMTSATTVLALIPVLTSNGRGSDVMVPMALPTFGGMLVVLLTIFATPTLYCWVRERSVVGGDARAGQQP